MISTIFVLILSFSGSLNAAQPAKRMINEQQARSYLNHVLTTLCLPQNHTGIFRSEIKEFVDNTTKFLLKKQGKYTSFWSMHKVYTDDELYEPAVGELLSFIEHKILVHADQEIDSLLADKSKRRLILDVVVKNMRNEVLGITLRNGELHSRTFADYLGAQLKNKVIEALKEEIKRNMPKLPQQQLFATLECPVCLDEFKQADDKRVFLSCGHNICAICLREWYKAQGERAHCPQCRRAINIQDYAQQVFA